MVDRGRSLSQKRSPHVGQALQPDMIPEPVTLESLTYFRVRLESPAYFLTPLI
jgi:hypothetical protein